MDDPIDTFTLINRGLVVVGLVGMIAFEFALVAVGLSLAFGKVRESAHSLLTWVRSRVKMAKSKGE